MSHPSWVRGLKQLLLLINLYKNLSHPSWVRGLKHLSLIRCVLLWMSHPSWVRGLKRFVYTNAVEVLVVAPLVGAWIETLLMRIDSLKTESHPSWVRGLKLKVGERMKTEDTSHPSWVRGLKQYHNFF